MSLLDIISHPAKGCAVRCGITAPASLFGSSDPNAPLLIALAQEECESLLARHEWSALTAGNVIAAVATVSQGPFPQNIDRLVANAKIWNLTQQLPYVGPTNMSAWLELASGAAAAPAPGAYAIIASALNIFPAPRAGDQLVYYYISKSFVASNAGAPQVAFAADADTVVFPERLVGLGIIWRWKKSRGLAYAEDMASYERALELACSRDRGPAAAITVSKRRPSAGISSDGISSTWPGSIIV